MEYFLVIVSQIFKDKGYMFPEPAFTHDKICSFKENAVINLYYPIYPFPTKVDCGLVQCSNRDLFC